MATCSPLIATGALASVGIAEEVCFGNVPVNVELRRLRLTEFGGDGLVKDVYESAEIRGDREVADSRHGSRRVERTLAFEVSPGGQAMGFQAALGGIWHTPVPIDASVINLTATTVGDTVEVTASSFDFVAAQMYIGATVTFTGTGTTALNGKIFTVIGHASNKVILLPPVGLSFSSPASLTAGTFHVKGARVGKGSTLRTFTIEVAMPDVGEFIVYEGNAFNGFSLNLPPSGMATGSFPVIGKDARSPATGSIDGVAALVKDATDMTSLTFDGAAGTITRGSGSWITDGFTAGDRIIVDGTGITDGQNRNPRTITEVSSATIIKVAEAIQTGGPYTTPFTVTRVGLPAWLSATDKSPVAAVNGALIINGTPVATCTNMTVEHSPGIEGVQVIGSNVTPTLKFGVNGPTTGNITFLYEKGGVGAQLLSAFNDETDNMSIVLRMDTPDGNDAVAIVLTRVKINTASFGFSQEATVMVSSGYGAYKPKADHPEVGESSIYIYDTTVTGVEPPTAALTLTKVSETGGVATLKVEGGVAPYSFVFDTSETPILVPVAGEFTHDYVSNATYASTISDASTPTKTADLSVVITSV